MSSLINNIYFSKIWTLDGNDLTLARLSSSSMQPSRSSPRENVPHRPEFALARSHVRGLRVSSLHGDVHFLLVHREDSEIAEKEKKGARGSLLIRARARARAHFRSCRCRLRLKKPRIVVAPSFLLRFSPSLSPRWSFFFPSAAIYRWDALLRELCIFCAIAVESFRENPIAV